MPFILTANELRGGRVVYLDTERGQWQAHPDQARRAPTKEEALELYQSAVAKRPELKDVVEPYPVEIDAQSGNIKLRRERIRAQGPTIDYQVDSSPARAEP